MPGNDVDNRVHNFFQQINLSQSQHRMQSVERNWTVFNNDLWAGNERQIGRAFNRKKGRIRSRNCRRKTSIRSWKSLSGGTLHQWKIPTAVQKRDVEDRIVSHNVDADDSDMEVKSDKEIFSLSNIVCNDDENGNDNMEALLMELEQIKNDRAKENLQKELWAPAPPSYENIWQLLSKFNDSDRKMIRGLKEGDPEDEMLSIIDNYKEQREQSERNLRLIHTPSLPSPDPNQSSHEGPCGMIPSPAPSPL